MPWESNIVFFLFKCTEYRERVLKDNVKDGKKVAYDYYFQRIQRFG
jgi:hypothetical protein